MAEETIVAGDVVSSPSAPTKEEVEFKEFMAYVTGSSSEPPASFEKIMNSIVHKMQVHTSHSIVKSMNRQLNLANFIEKCERVIFSEDLIDQMAPEDTIERYNLAVRTLGGLQEFQRKFIVQNKIEPKTDTPQEKILAKLMSASPDKLEKVVELLDNEEVDL